MKALHILKIVLKDTVMSSEKEYINEAIKELEDLQNRSCSNCKFVGYFEMHDSIVCTNKDCNFYCAVVDIFTSCNKWESQ